MKNEDIVRKYWKDFEQLATDLVVDSFNIPIDIVYSTQPFKDGGFDGKISSDIFKLDKRNVHYNALMEAKLRSSVNVGLRDFAASLLIAYCEVANTMVIVTNKDFTKQALNYVAKFYFKTNMDIVLVEGKTLSGWLKRRQEQILERYPKQLINFLLENHGDAISQLSVILDEPESMSYQPYKYKASIETGWHKDKIAKCKLYIEPVSKEQEIIDTPIGTLRKEIIQKITTVLLQGKSTIIIKGDAGIGKSTVVQNIVYNLKENDTQNNYRIFFLDIGSIKTSRNLFLVLLKVISGFDLNLFKDEGVYANNIDFFLEKVGGEYITKEMRDAVKQVFEESDIDFDKKHSLNITPLKNYLRLLAYPYLKSFRQILIFQELNRASSELLSFIHELTVSLSECNLSFLIELRTHAAISNSGINLMSFEEWEHFLNLFSKTADYTFAISQLSEQEAKGYLEMLLPKIGNDRAKVIIDKVGRTPLFLKLTSKWLKINDILSSYKNDIQLVEKLEMFYENLSPDNITPILDQILLEYTKNSKTFRILLAAASLFEGKINTSLIEELLPLEEADQIAEKLLDSGLFIKSVDSPLEFKISHDLLKERLYAQSSKYSFKEWDDLPIRVDLPCMPMQAMIAKQLISNLNIITRNTHEQKIYSIYLWTSLHEWNNALKLSLEVANGLVKEHQWGNAARFYQIAFQLIQVTNIEVKKKNYKQILLLIDYLELEILRYKIGTQTSEKYLEILNARIFFTPNLEEKYDNGLSILLRVKYLNWRHYHVKEEFKIAFDLAKEAYKIASQSFQNCEINKEILGKAFSSYAIANKAIGERQKSIDIFEEAVLKIPKSIHAKAERLSNLAAYNLSKEPEISLGFYKELINLTQNTDYSFSEIIHAHIDIAMAYFLKNDYNKAKKQAQQAIAFAADHGVGAEEARGRNILGCCYWVEEKLPEARQQFELAIIASERSISYRFLWRMRLNLAGVNIELQNNDMALALTLSGIKMILKSRMHRFVQFKENQNYLTSRWYAALMAGAKYLSFLDKDELQKIYGLVDLPGFQTHTENIVQNKIVPPFSKTSYFHNGRIMISG
jgi:tetratricopeptide (TPR) repeat protein